MNWRRAACESSACVEVAWQRAACDTGGTCVEVGHDGDAVLVRSSLKPDVIVRLTPEEWAVFVGGIKRGEFDDGAGLAEVRQ